MKNQPFQLPNFGNNRTASPTLNLLEQTSLSRLSPPPHRLTCASCNGQLDSSDEHTEAKIRRNYRGQITNESK